MGCISITLAPPMLYSQGTCMKRKPKEGERVPHTQLLGLRGWFVGHSLKGEALTPSPNRALFGQPQPEPLPSVSQTTLSLN